MRQIITSIPYVNFFLKNKYADAIYVEQHITCVLMLDLSNVAIVGHSSGHFNGNSDVTAAIAVMEISIREKFRT